MRVSRRAYLKKLEAETVVVHTRDGGSIRGVLLAARSDVYMLRHAAYLTDDGSRLTIDGELLPPVARVGFIQRILAAEAP